MTILLYLTTAVLLAIALVHALWGIGFWFPIRDEAKLVRAVVGAANTTRMPGPIPCALVAAAVLVVAVSLWSPVWWLQGVILRLAVVVFAVRGILAYVPFWRRMTPQEPFATYDRRFYSPLSLAIALAIAVLTFKN